MWVLTSLVTSLLASGAVARPRKMDDSDPLQQKSRVTAFVVDDKGRPSVECWEITHMVDSLQMTRKDGSKARAHGLTLASRSELEGLDILTWPSVSPIWPPPTDDDLHADYFDLQNTFNLFSVQGGLINFNFYAARFGATSDDDDEVETHIFNLENGDDWFYFEDSSSSSLALTTSDSYPFEISTISATETELLRLRFPQQPKHSVLHKGACKFTGIETPSDSSSAAGTRNSRTHSPLTVQVNIEDL